MVGQQGYKKHRSSNEIGFIRTINIHTYSKMHSGYCSGRAIVLLNSARSVSFAPRRRWCERKARTLHPTGARCINAPDVETILRDDHNEESATERAYASALAIQKREKTNTHTHTDTIHNNSNDDDDDVVSRSRAAHRRAK